MIQYDVYAQKKLLVGYDCKQEPITTIDSVYLNSYTNKQAALSYARQYEKTHPDLLRCIVQQGHKIIS